MTHSPLALAIPALVSNSRDRTSAPRSVFDRLVARNTGGEPNEVAATELIRAVLDADSAAMLRITGWLCTTANLALEAATLRWTVATEGRIYNKRDDLRFEGVDALGELLAVLTVEVKVASGFHYSGATVDVPTEGDGLMQERDVVLQLTDYDAWLASHPAPFVAGFVLARQDTSATLAREGLQERWSPIRWRELAHKLLDTDPADDSSPVSDLARHAGRYVLRHIVRPEDLVNPRLELADLALLQAFAERGRATQQRARAIVEPLLDVLAEARLSDHTPVLQDHAFGTHAREIVYVSLHPTDRRAPPYLIAGLATVGELQPVVWLESHPGLPMKARVQALVAEFLPALQARNARWAAIPQDGSEWRDVQLSAPLGAFFAAEDQARFVADFVRSGIADLVESGLVARVASVAA